MDVLPYLDRHLIYPILDFFQNNGSYSEEAMLQAKYDLLHDTNMPGHCAELYKQIHATTQVPESFATKQSEIDKQLEALETRSQKVLEVIEKPEVASALRQDKAQNLVFLQDSHGISIDEINVLFNLGQFDYNRGNYSGAIDHLYHFRVLSTDQKMTTAATWGMLASEILTANWDDALSELTKLKDQIDSDSLDSISQLRNRTWLLHWSLFPLHKSDSYKATDLQDLFFTPAYLNAIQTSAPHLLRYLSIAVLTTSQTSKPGANNSNRRLRDLIRILEAEKSYDDPITNFAKALFSRYDFAFLSTQYDAVERCISEDYFLAGSAETVLRSLKISVIEAYLRLHRTTELETLSKVVDMSEVDVKTLITRDLEHLNADVDEDDGTIEVMREHSQSSLQELVSKTKSLISRTAAAQAAMPRLVR